MPQSAEQEGHQTHVVSKETVVPPGLWLMSQSHRVQPGPQALAAWTSNELRIHHKPGINMLQLSVITLRQALHSAHLSVC
jgi:hypothetical protein